MDDEPDLPEGYEEMLQEALASGEISVSDLLIGQIEALIKEAQEEFRERDSDGSTSSANYYDPYKSGPAMIWRLTDQMGIDAEQVSWWFAALALKDDGAPFYLIHTGLKDDAVERDICGIQKANRLALADAFEAAERHHLGERTEGGCGE
jgi:hypothetical protein